jgi:hypothetical protein
MFDNKTRSALIKLAASVSPESAERRILLATLRKMSEEVGEEESKPSSSQGKVPGGILLKFLGEQGDNKLKNPDTGNLVKVKTLSSKPKDTAAYKTFKKLFEQWLEQQKKDDASGGKKPSKDKKDTKSEEKPKVKADFVEDYHDWGTEYNDIRKNWDSTQVGAAYTYTGYEYKAINNYLRGSSAELPEHLRETIEGLDSLFESEAGKMHKAVKVVRGVSTDHPIVAAYRDSKLKPGMIFEDAAYQSTTIKRGGVWGDLQMHIAVPKGAEAVYLGPPPDSFSKYEEEREVLLNRGTKLKFTGFDADNLVYNFEVVVDE